MVGNPHLTLKGIRWSSTLGAMNGPGNQPLTHVVQPRLGHLPSMSNEKGYTNNIVEGVAN